MVYELEDISKYNLHPDLENILRAGIAGKDGDVVNNLIWKALKLNEELYKDPRTGLYNVKHFEESVKKHISLANRQGIPFSVLIADIDHFKEYNDEFGHEKGNELLKEISNLFKRLMREEDIIARYGGEEFAFILPDTPKILSLGYKLNNSRSVLDYKKVKIQEPNITKAAGNRLVEGVREHFQNIGVEEMKGITISVGGAMYPIEAVDRDQLVTLADARLYMAKKEGKNRAVFY